MRFFLSWVLWICDSGPGAGFSMRHDAAKKAIRVGVGPLRPQNRTLGA